MRFSRRVPLFFDDKALLRGFTRAGKSGTVCGSTSDMIKGIWSVPIRPVELGRRSRSKVDRHRDSSTSLAAFALAAGEHMLLRSL